MSLPSITVDSNNGPINVEIIFGHAVFGSYRLWIWDPSGKQKRLLQEGVNTDYVPDVATIDVSNLDKEILHWQVRVSSFGPATTGMRFSVTVIIRQGGKPVKNAVFTWSGNLGDTPQDNEGGVRVLVQ